MNEWDKQIKSYFSPLETKVIEIPFPSLQLPEKKIQRFTEKHKNRKNIRQEAKSSGFNL